MSHTRSQDLEARFTTLHSNFIETQQEVGHLSDNIATINQRMHSSIATSIIEIKDELKQDITTQHEYITTMICTKLHIPADLPYLTPICIPKVKPPPIPIIFSPITFSVTYAFHMRM
jgi:hypothetical protein